MFVQSRAIEVSLFPYAVLLQVTPVVAIAPLIIILVKNTQASLTICATLVALFPIISNTTLGLRSVMGVPMMTRGRVGGVLSLASASIPFSVADLRLAQSFVRMVASALENAQLYVGAVEALRARDEFLALASHELNTPITGLQLCSERLVRAGQSTWAGRIHEAQLLKGPAMFIGPDTCPSEPAKSAVIVSLCLRTVSLTVKGSSASAPGAMTPSPSKTSVELASPSGRRRNAARIIVSE